MSTLQAQRKLAVILHADVAGSTALVQRDETVAHERITDAFNRFSQTIGSFGGTVHEIRGDALVAEFARASDAVCAALAFQQSQAEHLQTLADGMAPRLRIGISLGEVVFADGTVTGAGVVLAQRVEQLSEPDGVCVTGAIHEALPQRMLFDQSDLGERQLKGFDEPIHVYAVRLSEGTEVPAPTDIQGARRQSTIKWVAAAALAAFVIGGILLTWLQPRMAEIEPASVDKMAYALPDKPSIAVLPFENLSGDSEQDYLADGMTESLIATLSQIPELFVIARNSVFTYKGQPVRVQQVSEELGVRYVLEGSIQRAGERVRTTVQLIDATRGHHLWAEAYDRELVDIFALQDEIALQTTVALQVVLTEGERARLRSSTTKDLGAWLDYMRAYSNYETFTREGNARARELWEGALLRDPEFVDARLKIAFTHFIDARLGYSNDPAESMRMAAKIAEEVAALAPDLPYLPLLRGQIHLTRGDLDAAVADHIHAAELSPSDARILASLGMAFLYAGQFDEAIQSTRQAMRLNPSFPTWYLFYLGRAHVYKGEYEQGIEAADRGLTRPESSFVAAAHYVTKAFAYADSGNIEDARQQVEAALTEAPYISIALYSKAFSFKNPADWKRFAEALRKAGLPEE